MIYYLILVILILASLYESANFYGPTLVTGLSNKGKNNKLIFVVLAFVLIMLAGLRYQTGQDWMTYKYLFDNPYDLIWWTYEEHGYILLNRFFGFFFDNYYLFQFLINIFCGIIIFKEIYKKSQSPIFILLVYYIFNYTFLIDMTMNRMHIAIAILIVGKRFIDDRRVIPWGLVVLLAMQFHVTAVLTFPLFWTSKIRISRKIAIIMLTCSVIITLFGHAFTINIMGVFSNLSFLPNRLSHLLANYMLSADQRSGEIKSGLGMLALLLFQYFMVFAHDSGSDDTKNTACLNFLIATIINSLGVNFDLLGRLSYYYMIAGLGIVSYNLINEGNYCLLGKYRFSDQSDKMVKYFMIVAFISFKCITFYMSWVSAYRSDYYPYMNFIFK